VHMADNLNTFMHLLFWNMGASTTWNPQGINKNCLTFYLWIIRTVQLMMMAMVIIKIILLLIIISLLLGL